MARLDGDRLRIEQRALIAQRTGEDWRGVALSLSTADAQRFTELPELAAAKIGRRQPAPPRTGWRPPPTGVAELYRDWDRAFGGGAPPAPALPPDPEAGRDEAPAPPPPFEAVEELDRLAAPEMPPQMRGAPMPPPSMMMPMAPPMMARSRSGVLGGLARAATGAVVGAAGAVAGAAGAIGGLARGGDGGGRAPGAAPHADDGLADGEPAEIAAPADLLAFGDLRMPPPSSSGRGSLVRAGRRERYLALLGVTVQVDVVALVDRAVRDAGRVAPPPPEVTCGWSSSYDYALPADGLVDVPSDGQWHGVALGVAEAPARVRHVVVPRETTDVFRVAELTSPFETPLLPGPMDVYDGKDFVLTAPLAEVAPRGKVELGLGVDPQVKVTRNVDFREEVAGMLRGSLRLIHEVEITGENLGARAIALEVRERVPVAEPGDDDVEVTVEAARPPWEPWAPDPDRPGAAHLRGGHRWRVDLEPGARTTLTATYAVRIAGKHELIGGNRREP